jgi:hypothetical protein
MNYIRQLSELHRIIDIFGSNSSKYLFHPKSKSTNLSLLAQKIDAPGDGNEHEWAMEICGSDENSRAYIRLRSRLKRRLLGYLFHLDIRTGSEFRRALYRSAKDVLCIRILVMLGARGVAMWLIPPALERAQKYELTQDQIELLLLLRQDAAVNGYLTKFTEYVNDLDEAMKLRAAEMKMQAMSDEINVELVAKAGASEKAKELALAARPEAAKLFWQFPTFNVGLNYYRIASLAAESADDSFDTFQMCRQAEEFLSRFPHLNNLLYMGQFALKRLTSAIAIQDFKGAHLAVQSCELCFPDNSNNWFIWKESELHLLLHSKEWHLASALHKEIVNHDRFPVQPEQVRQKWALLGYYTAFAASVQESSIHAAWSSIFNKVLREIPIYKRDKAGYNASLYTLQYLILASRGDHEELVKTSDAIVRYMDRYLRGRHDGQLYGFLKTLVLLNKNDYDVERTKLRAKRYIDQFQRFGREMVDETQTLRFDMMWDWISEWVDTRTKMNMHK